MQTEIAAAGIGALSAVVAAVIPPFAQSAVAKNLEAVQACATTRDLLPEGSKERALMSEALIYLAVRQEKLSSQWRLNAWAANLFLVGLVLSQAAFLLGEPSLGWIILGTFVVLTASSGTWATPKTLRSSPR